jgi:hypothetical protein
MKKLSPRSQHEETIIGATSRLPFKVGRSTALRDRR